MTSIQDNFFIVILIVFGLLICGASAWYFDDFTSDTSASYTGTNIPANWFWDVPNGNLSGGPYTGAYDQNQLYYNGETYSKGNFSYRFIPNATGGIGSSVYRPSIYFGAGDLYTTTAPNIGGCKPGQTMYTAYLVGDFGGNPRFYLDKCVAGSYSSLATGDVDQSWIIDNTHWFYLIVNWNPAGLTAPFLSGETINITLWKDGSGETHYMSSTDTDITSGYTGLGSRYWTVFYSWDWINFKPLSAPPVAAFSGTPTSGVYPLNVVFTDASTNTPTSWHWDFGDGGTSTLQNPTHIYNFAGIFDVNLTAINGAGTDTENKSAYITVTTPPPIYPTIKPSFVNGNGTLEVINYQPFIDYRLWVSLFFISLFALILSHALGRANEFWAVIAFVFAIATMLGVIGLGIYNDPIPYIINQTKVNISTVSYIINDTYNTTYGNLYSVTLLGSIWLLILFIAYTILAFLNIIYVYVEIIMKKELPKQETDVEIGQQKTWSVKENEFYPR